MADQHYERDDDENQNHGTRDNQHRSSHLFLGLESRGFFLVFEFHRDILALSGGQIVKRKAP
jgi:hypothetical protein